MFREWRERVEKVARDAAKESEGLMMALLYWNILPTGVYVIKNNITCCMHTDTLVQLTVRSDGMADCHSFACVRHRAHWNVSEHEQLTVSDMQVRKGKFVSTFPYPLASVPRSIKRRYVPEQQYSPSFRPQHLLTSDISSDSQANVNLHNINALCTI
jgi:hypothetical protein